MFLLTHAGFRLLWELSSENVSVCTLAHARVCDMTSRNYRAPVDQIYPQILGKPVWISHGLGEYCFCFFFCWCNPFLYVCVSLLRRGRFEELFIWNFRSGLHGEAPGLPLKSGVAADCVTPPTSSPLFFTSPISSQLVSFFLTGTHSSPFFTFYWLTFTDVLAMSSSQTPLFVVIPGLR